MKSDAFTEFEHRGWQRVADKYDSTFATSTRQFIPFLLDAAEVGERMSILDVGCGPGYVSAAAAGRGATPIGLDFSGEMIAIARQKFPAIEFHEGDAQNLPFADSTFDCVLASFALLHLTDPERGCAEACRVLKPGGRFAFTTWARKEENLFLQLVDDAVRAHADLEVGLPPGPPYYLFENEEEFRNALERAGFEGATMKFNRRTVDWQVPTARFVFDAELNAGVRMGGLLAKQTPDKLSAIRSAIERPCALMQRPTDFQFPKALTSSQSQNRDRERRPTNATAGESRIPLRARCGRAFHSSLDAALESTLGIHR